MQNIDCAALAEIFGPSEERNPERRIAIQEGFEAAFPGRGISQHVRLSTVECHVVHLHGIYGAGPSERDAIRDWMKKAEKCV